MKIYQNIIINKQATQNKIFKMQFDGYKFSKAPVGKTNIYLLYDANKNGKKYKAKIFKLKQVQYYNMRQVIQYNTEVFWQITDKLQIHPIKQISVYDLGQIYYYEYYQETLKQYLEYHNFTEKQIISIFKQIMRALYALITRGYYPRNLRAQHFVKIGDQWKIHSLVFQKEYQKYKGLESQYIWNPKYQFPQAYKNNQFLENQLDESLVWNIGCIVLSMKENFHRLSSYQNIFKFCQNYPKQAGNQNSFSSLLQKMLKFNKNQRIKLAELFDHPIFNKEFDKKVIAKSKNIRQGTVVGDSVQLREKNKLKRIKMKQKSRNQKSKQQLALFQKSFIWKQQKLLESYKSLSSNQEFYLFTSQNRLLLQSNLGKIIQLQKNSNIQSKQESWNKQLEKAKLQRIKSKAIYIEQKLPEQSGIINSSNFYQKQQIKENPTNINKPNIKLINSQNMTQKNNKNQREQANMKTDKKINQVQQSNVKFQQMQLSQNSLVRPKTNNSPNLYQSSSQLQNANLDNLETIRSITIKLDRKTMFILNKYKQQMDKNDFLQLVAQKVDQVPFPQNAKQFILLSKFMLIFCSLSSMYPFLKSLNRHENYFKINQEDFSEFQSHGQFNNIKLVTNQSFEKKNKIYVDLKKKLEKINLKNLQFKNLELIKKIIISDPKQTTFQQLKIPYRTVLTPAYKLISKKYNQMSDLDTKPEEVKQLMVLGGYIVFALAIDKVFIPDDIQDNFKIYYQWKKLSKPSPIFLHEIKDYIQKATPNYLIKQATYILEKYYSV